VLTNQRNVNRPAGARGGFFVTGPDAQAEQRNRT